MELPESFSKFRGKTGTLGGIIHIPTGTPPGSPVAILMVKPKARRKFSLPKETKIVGKQDCIFLKENFPEDHDYNYPYHITSKKVSFCTKRKEY